MQQFEGDSLIKRGSLMIGLGFMLIKIYRFVLFTKYCLQYFCCCKLSSVVLKIMISFNGALYNQ
jgi:hypothetical protein